ncbi:hypothetical protein [Nonomuraea angiospora]|uniref:hypothetical protein n=1 Tax=Nonomuraea angiospora TaxID=46172 RepID=UPI0029BB6AA0|nr:hypothetical protein [Nonomuraea angiospora]MDX3109708.1 hypothetical protein [Nonomuraea angiospora]
MSVIGKAEGINHGTPGGYKQHLHRQVEPCDDCREANRAARAAARQKARQQQARIKAAMAPTAQQMYIRPFPPYLPGHTDPAWGVPVAGRELAVGDVIIFLGRRYPIDRFEPYVGELASVLGKGARTAWSGSWAMAIGPDRTIRIRPREER